MINDVDEVETRAPATEQVVPVNNGAPLNVRLAHSMVRWSFLIFIFSIPFEVMDLLGVAEMFSLAKFFALQFLLVSLLCTEWTFARPERSFWYFLAYVGAFVIFGIPWVSRYGDEILSRLLTLVQLLVIYWVGINVLQDDSAYAKTLTALGLSCTLVVILRMTGFAFGGLQYGEFLRVSAFNQNPNGYALTLAFGAITLLGRTRLRLFPLWFPLRALYWACSILLVFEILATGARGGFLALLAGLLVLYSADGPFWLGIVKGGLIVLTLAFIFLGLFGSETSKSRWEETFTEGDIAQRDIIYPAAIKMGTERPLLGWGPVAHLYELGRRLHWPEGYRDTHNDILWVWTEVGLVGSIPFLIGLWLWLKGAWRGRWGPWGTVPLAVLTFMFAMCMSGSHHYTKLFWLAGMLAIVAGTAPAARPDAGGTESPDEPLGDAL